MVVVLIHPAIKQIKHRHLHHALVEIRSLVLDHLHSNHLLRLQVLTLDDLAEGALAEYIENQVSILMVRLFRSQNVVNIQDIIAVLVIVSIILDSLARFCKDTSWVS